MLDPDVEGAGDTNPEVVVGAAAVAPRILGYIGPAGARTLLPVPVGCRIGVVAPPGRRGAAGAGGRRGWQRRGDATTGANRVA